MKKMDVHEEFLNRGNKAADEIADLAVASRPILKQVVDGATSPKKRIKNAAAKTLKRVSEMNPKALYPCFELFVDFIDGEDTILKWIAMDVIGNLAYVDKDNRLNKRVLSRYLSLLYDDALVTAAHSVDNLWKIAINKKRYQREITAKLVEADSVGRNDECRRILAGKVIAALGEYVDQMGKVEREKAVAYAGRHTASSRNATKRKARSFLERVHT